ncbi:hypothetical protein [Prosthecobacter sp.]|uniref:hypothetical protein n=1 Tax=Prosthecobacter sp. TaxID=1965333 RepID=UPI0024897362|nr:hypothetical protein [Prosthecobacter sp.]MDI1310790.1 hypothetical protein [Prosthecobacter sp.]
MRKDTTRCHPMKINTSITIDPRIAKLAKKYAALDGRSFANYVERAVARQVEQDQNAESPSPKAKPAKKK